MYVITDVFRQLESFFVQNEEPKAVVLDELESIHACGSCDPRFCPMCEAEQNEGV